MRLKIFLFLTTLSLLQAIDAFGETYHYSLVATVTGGVKKSSSGDGHYLTFTPKGVYESDADGFSLGFGLLKYVGTDSNGHKCYEGNGYLGDWLVYRVTSNYERINVVLPDKKIAVYVRSSSSSGKERVYSRPDTEIVYPDAPSYSSPSSGNSSRTEPQKRVVTCPGCGGRGYIEAPVPTVSHFGISKPVWKTCPKCGRRYDANEGHHCVPCKVCGGKGTITR